MDVGVTNSSPTAEKSRKLSVLVVDDELLIRWSLTEALEERGHTVAEAADAASAVRAVSEGQRPDVVLLDFRLPDSADLGLLATIRRAVPQAQVIMMTAHGTPELVAGALALGAYRVVNKPFEVHEMTDLVQQASAATP